MNVDHLVHMANQIGQFFEAMPDRDEALEGIADHIRKFWAVRMRTALAAHWADGGAGLTPIVKRALGQHSILQQAVRVAAFDDPAKAVERHDWDGASEA